MSKIYGMPETIYRLSDLMMKQENVLIGGTTGSGKSVLLNTFMTDAVMCGKQFYLIDPKRIELVMYKDLPNTIDYTNKISQVERIIDECLYVMESRYKQLEAHRQRKGDFGDVYLVFDEFAAIKTSAPNIRDIENKLVSLITQGRAANVHVILLTQRCTNDILNNRIKACFTCNIGLRTRNAQESRNIIGYNGCELLSKCGYCYVVCPDYMKPVLWKVDMYSDEQIQDKIDKFLEYNRKRKEEESLHKNVNILKVLFG